MTGPLLTGKILALGLGTTGILIASAPGIALSAIAWLHYLPISHPLRNNRNQSYLKELRLLFY
jgi:hypothetical protein